MPASPPSPAGEELTRARAVRRLQITASRLTTADFAGEYRSAFRGRGIEFDQVGEYQPGDDVRSIDWNVTARQGRPFVKSFVEERELTLLLLLDRSASMDFGTVRATKLETAIEACSLLAFAALRSNDRIGLLTFGDGDLRYLPPGKGKHHLLRLIRTAMTPATPGAPVAGLTDALDHLIHAVRGRVLACIFSDFIDTLPARPIAAVAARHDTVAVTVSDPAEHDLPPAGLLRLADAETGDLRLVDTDSDAVRADYRRQAARRLTERREALTSTGTALLELGSQTPPLYPLMRFFRSRQQRRRK
jgi:uncharacterized protein (DUF58 family)